MTVGWKKVGEDGVKTIVILNNQITNINDINNVITSSHFIFVLIWAQFSFYIQSVISIETNFIPKTKNLSQPHNN